MHVLIIYKAIAYLIYLCLVVVFSCSFLGFYLTKNILLIVNIFTQRKLKVQL